MTTPMENGAERLPTQLPDAELQQEALNDERIGNLLASVGNHEAKAALYLSMKPGERYGRTAAYTLMDEMQAGEPGYAPNINSFFNYLSESLEPIGLVAKYTLEGEGIKFEKVPDEAAEALAAGLSAISLEHPEVSLGGIFGQTQSKGDRKDEGVRSPLRRFQIGEALVLMGEPIGDTDLAELLQDNYTSTTGHIRRLAELGIVTYRSDEPHSIDPTIIFGVLPEDYVYETGLKKMTADVIAAAQLIGTSSFGKRQLLETMREQRPEYREHKGFASNVGRALKRMEREGYIVQEGLMDRENQSAVSLSPDQLILWEKIVLLVRGVQKNDLSIMHAALDASASLKAEPAKIRALVAKGFSNSGKVLFNSHNESSKNVVLSAIHPDEQLTSKEIAERVAARGLGLHAVRGVLRDLRQSGYVVSDPKGAYHLWSRTEESHR